jgi:hypothetical protein
MRIDREHWQSLLVMLQNSLQALAAPVDVQLSLLPDFVLKPDELALDFDDWYQTVFSNVQDELTQEQKSRLNSLNQVLEQMSNEANSHLWTEEALAKSAEWEQVREIAKATLESFGWNGNVRPPTK